MASKASSYRERSGEHYRETRKFIYKGINQVTQQLRVLQFITPAGFYGAERWVLALANNIDRHQVTCDLAVTHEGPEQDLRLAELYPADTEQKVHYLKMKSRFDPGVISQLCSIIRERKINLIHTHGYKSDILGLVAAKRMGIACVSTPHGFSGKVGLKLSAFIKVGTHLLRYFDRVAPLSEELMNDMKRFGVPEARTRFIRNGVDLSEIDASLERSPGGSTDREGHTIGFIGQIIPRKGVGDLLQMFEDLYSQDPHLNLHLVGDGAQRQELEQMAGGLKSSKAIQFLGFRTDRLELLSGFDLFVMTSSLEGIPRCMMEAMAVGVPVVAYDIPGVDQLIEHRRTGLLAPFGDKVALAACCRELLDDRELAKKLVSNARDLIQERYSAARMAREYEGLFQELAELSRKTSKASQAG